LHVFSHSAVNDLLFPSRKCRDIFHFDSQISFSKPNEWQKTLGAPSPYRGVGDLEINRDLKNGQQLIQAV
jgi:hypothetical protein